MAGEIKAALRTLFIFVTICWGSITFLVIYRIPSLETQGHQQASERSDPGTEQLKSRWRRDLGFITNSRSEFFPQRLRTRDVGKDLGSTKRKLHFVTNDKNDDDYVFKEKIYDDQLQFKKDPQQSGVEKGKYGIDLTWNPNQFSCQELSSVKFLSVLGQGYTKTVQMGFLRGKEMAFKYISPENHDILECIKLRPLEQHFECYNLAKFKLLKEAMLLQQLQHPGIVKLQGVCLWDENSSESLSGGMVVATEIGSPLGIMKMIQMPWDERFKISLDLINLLAYLEHSPLGSLIIRDFRIEQFVLVNGMVKLTDLDDMDGKPKTCKSRNDCLIGGERWNTSVPCTKGRCENYNAKSNLYHLYRTFLDYTLDFENPQGAEHDLKGIAEKIRNFTVNAKELLQELLLVVNNIKMGKYAIRYRKEGSSHRPKYEKYPGASVPSGSFDYYCQRSRTLRTCELAVYDLEEAESICSSDPECKAFVLTPKRNWLGIFECSHCSTATKARGSPHNRMTSCKGFRGDKSVSESKDCTTPVKWETSGTQFPVYNVRSGDVTIDIAAVRSGDVLLPCIQEQQ